MTVLYYLAALLAAGGVFAALYFMRGKNLLPRFNNRQLAAFVYGVLFFVRAFGGKYAIQETVGLNVYSPFGAQGGLLAFASIVLLWLLFTVQLTLVTYTFFEDHLPLITPIIRYVTTAVYAVSLIALPILTRAMDGDLASVFHWRSLVFALEIGVGLGLSVTYLLDGVKIRQTAKQWLSTALIFLGMFLISLPAWAPQALFGLGNSAVKIDDFNVYHRIVLYGSLAFIFAVHFLLRKFSYEQKRYALLYISMATMISFCFKYDFSTFLHLADWPLHLCNTAMFIIPLVLIFRMEKLYYFTIFINVLGAFLAMIMPNTDGANWLATRTFEFWFNHYIAFALPVLIMTLGIFKRPKMKQFVYSLIAFFCYYAFVLIANAVLTGLGNETDFFFINSDFVASKLGDWAEDLRKITFDLNTILGIGESKFIIYPVYQLIYFTVYIVLSFAMWFLYEQVFEITDTYAIIMERNRKIKRLRVLLGTSYVLLALTDFLGYALTRANTITRRVILSQR